jgi:hypothetical protein
MSQTVIFMIIDTISHTECQHFFNVTEPAPRRESLFQIRQRFLLISH